MKFKTKIATLAIATFNMLVQSIWAQKPNEIQRIKFEDEGWEQMAPQLQRKYVYGEKGMLALFKMDKGAKVPLQPLFY